MSGSVPPFQHLPRYRAKKPQINHKNNFDFLMLGILNVYYKCINFTFYPVIPHTLKRRRCSAQYLFEHYK